MTATGAEGVVTALTDTGIRNAIAAVQTASGNQGGVVLLPPGTYLISAPIVVPKKIILQGSGKSSTILLRQSDIVVLDISGQAGGSAGPGGVGGHVSSVIVADLQIQGNNPAWTTNPGVRMAYAHVCEFRSCIFSFFGGVAFYMQCEVWDSTWSECRFDNSGGTNTGQPAVLVQSADGATFPAFGSSGDSTNDLRFYHCTFEGFRDGAFWAKTGQPGAQPMGNFQFYGCKADQNATCLGDWFRFEGCTGIVLRDLDLASTNAGTAYAGTPFNMFTFLACKSVIIDSVNHYQKSGQTNSLFYFDGTTTFGYGNRYITVSAVEVSQQGGSAQAFATNMIVYKVNNGNINFDYITQPKYNVGNSLSMKPIFGLEAGTTTYATSMYKPIPSRSGDYSDSVIGTQDPGLPTGLAELAGINTANNKLWFRYPDGSYHYVTLT